jgi:transposase
MVQYDYIRYLYFNEGLSQRAIAKKVGVHRNTVRRAIEDTTNEYTLKSIKPKPVNGEFKELVEKMVKENHLKARKHKLTKKRMYELMVDQEYTGSYSTFTSLVRSIEQDLQEAFLKLKQKPGTLQVDFGEMVVMQNNIPRKVIVFCAKLCNSKVEFVKAYPRQSTEFFLDGLNSTFEFLGGIPRKIMFDNLKQAVKNISKNGGRILQDNFIKFKAFYAFDAAFCGPRKGNEKGAVENLVKYVRNNYFLPYIEFKDFHSLNEDLRDLNIKRMTSTKIDNSTWRMLLKEEAEEGFMDFKEVYDPSVSIDAKVDTYQIIHVDSNRYSIPTRFVGKRLQVRLYPFKVVVCDKDIIVAEHTRVFGKNKDILNPYHYLDLLKRKPRAFDDAKVMQEWALPEIYNEYHRQLKAHRNSNSKGTKEFIEILRLTETYGITTIKKILKVLHERNQYSYEQVLSYLRKDAMSINTAQVLNYDQLITKNIYEIKSYNMPIEVYDSLIVSGGR